MINGHAKIFDENLALGTHDTTITDASTNPSADNAIDRNPDTYWRTSDSDDLTTETLVVAFASSVTINRLAFLDINWKEFNAKYFSSGSFTAFAGVVGIDGALSGVSETTFSDGTAYYEVTAVVTNQIQIQVTKTQIANAQKFCSQIIATTELGTLKGYPNIRPIETDRNIRAKKTLSGRSVIQKSIEVFGFAFDFKDYPSISAYNADFDLMLSLHDRDEPFLVWLCGGRRGSGYFHYTLRGFRMKDFIVVQISKMLKLSYSKNGYKNQINTTVEFDEVI